MSSPVALITGASDGIGRATAGALAKRGYRLALLARGAERLKQVAESLKDAIALPTDVTQFEQVRASIQRTEQRFGRIDAIVHCAGLAPVVSIEEMTVEQWHAVLDTNLSAAFYLCKAAWPIFQRQQSGVIINISSQSARDPFPGFAAYGAAKAGLNLFGWTAAREGQPIGVRVHTIAPGAVETEMFRQIMTPQQFSPDKTLDPAEVADLIVNCVQGDLRYTSGEVIYVRKTL